MTSHSWQYDTCMTSLDNTSPPSTSVLKLFHWMKTKLAKKQLSPIKVTYQNFVLYVEYLSCVVSAFSCLLSVWAIPCKVDAVFYKNSNWLWWSLQTYICIILENKSQMYITLLYRKKSLWSYTSPVVQTPSDLVDENP